MRAALALGFYDYSAGNYADAAKWLERAKNDPLLADYALYWSAETDLAQHQDAAALGRTPADSQDYPDSVITEQVAAVARRRPRSALNQPAEAVKALRCAIR